MDSGLGKLDGDTMDLAAALADFNSAISMGAGCGPAYVSRAMVKMAMIFDTPDVKAMRTRFGDTDTFDLITRDTYVSNALDTYNFNTSTMNGSQIQKLLTDTVLPLATSALADLITAESLPDTTFNFRVPGRFISSDTRAEVDIADVYFFHSMLLMARAAVEIANSWKLDISQDPRNFRGEGAEHGDSSSDTFIRELRTNTSFFERRTTWDTALSFFRSADSFVLRFLREGRREMDLQDTDLIYFDTDNQFFRQHIFDYVSDSDVADYEVDHADTLSRVFAGQDVYVQLTHENADLQYVQFNFSNLSSSPIHFSRASFATLPPPGIPSVFDRGFEWQEAFFPDPTFGNFLRGMTNNKLFLLFNGVDKTITISDFGPTGDTDLDLSYINRKPTTLDIKFNIVSGSVNPVTIRYSPPGRRTHWAFKVVPKKVLMQVDKPQHLRIFFDPDEDAFGSHEQAQLQKFIDSTLILIVPWTTTNADTVNPTDAGSNFMTFGNNYNVASPTTNDNEIQATFQDTASDKLILYKFDGFTFVPMLGSTVVPDVSMGTTTVRARIDTFTPLAGFGWFVVGEARPALQVLRGFLLGDKNTLLPKTFKVRLVNPLGALLGGEPVQFRVLQAPTGATSGSFTGVSGFPTITDAAGNLSAITDSTGVAEISYVMGNGGGIYVIEALAKNSGAFAFLFAFTKGFTPHPGNQWRMVSMPVYPNDTFGIVQVDAYNRGVPGPAVSMSSFIGDDFSLSTSKVYYWNPSFSNPDAKFADAGHIRYQDVSSGNAKMGRAYWLLTTANGVLDAVRPDSADVYAEVTETVYIPLHVGANMIGVPFPYPLRSSNLLVQTAPNGTPDTIDNVSSFVEHRLWWIAPTITANGAASSSYVSGGNPLTGASFPGMALFPFEGYWIKATSLCASAGCTLVFPPVPADSLPIGSDGKPVITGGGPGTAPAAPAFRAGPVLQASGGGLSDNWAVQLIVTSSGGVDVENLAGVRPPSSPQYMLSSSDPPMAPGAGAIALTFVENSQRYSTLFKSPGEEPTWTVEVTSASEGPVTIQPSDISSIPGSLPVMMRDESTGLVTDLRKELAYTYNSAANETRRFTFAAGTLDPTWRSYVRYPEMMCVAGRVFSGAPRILHPLRALRDLLLDSASGRLMVSLYYSFTPV